ncbi:hypothetical protein SOCEGT47_079100 [Sorangium cellulosum]|uniref:Uncharacterized protein n=1 Tax=Sorangium cellulosum TaxID=56 RepID=A0A4P2QDT4_SORCE|nr:hypothetical protein [Sorangium cellulosum]AUX27323.1 hypothetical protein SOCEGT47_079100 [Sorangium cellulosum]
MIRRAPGERAASAARWSPGRLLVASALLAAACARPGSERSGAPAGSIAALAEAEVAPAIGPPPARPPGSAPARSAPRASALDEEQLARALKRAPLRALRPAGKRGEGRFEATLALGAADSGAPAHEIEVRLAPALKKDPLGFRRPVAFYRLARALDAHVAPAAASRRIGIGELAALLGREPGGRRLLRRFAVMNDGTVDALVQSPAPGPPGPRWAAARLRSIRFDDAPELDVWARWARSRSPARGERASILRGYLEMLALDYLAGNGLRKEIVIDVSAGALVLEANASAFPPHVKARELDRQLERLVEAARFPRALHDALLRFGPEQAAAALRPGGGGIEDELVPPRALVELEERRQALLSLIAAKIAARGEAAVLAL